MGIGKLKILGVYVAKKAEGYGLPELTFATAAATLGITEAAFIEWLLVTVKPSHPRWHEWTMGKRPLPERLIRLYLKTKGETAVRLASVAPPDDPLAPLYAEFDSLRDDIRALPQEELRERIAHVMNQAGLLFRGKQRPREEPSRVTAKPSRGRKRHRSATS